MPGELLSQKTSILVPEMHMYVAGLWSLKIKRIAGPEVYHNPSLPDGTFLKSQLLSWAHLSPTVDIHIPPTL